MLEIKTLLILLLLITLKTKGKDIKMVCLTNPFVLLRNLEINCGR